MARSLPMRRFCLQANKRAYIQAMIEEVLLERCPTSFGRQGNLTIEGLEVLASQANGTW